MKINLSAIGALLFNLTAIPALWGAFMYQQGLNWLALANLIVAMGIMCYVAIRAGDKKTALFHMLGIVANLAILIRLYIL